MQEEIKKAPVNSRCLTTIKHMLAKLPQCWEQYYVVVPGTSLILVKTTKDSIISALKAANRIYHEVVYNYDGTSLVIYEFLR